MHSIKILLTCIKTSHNKQVIAHKYNYRLRMGSRHFTAPHEGAFEIKMHAFFTQPDQKTGREPVPWRKMESGKV